MKRLLIIYSIALTLLCDMDLFMTFMDNSRLDHGRRLGLLMIDGFSLMSYASLIEPFRAANVIRGEPIYRWFHVGLGASHAQASNGARIAVECQVGEDIECDILFVLSAGTPSAFRDRRTFAWLRKLDRQSVTIGGISGGPYVMARAGLLGQHCVTIHWEHQAELAEEFPLLMMRNDLYVIDQRRITCAGGTAALDLAIELIERDHGSSLAGQVSEWFIRTETRTAERPQRIGPRDRYGTANDIVLRALAVMEAQLESPLSRQALAHQVGISTRQLDRLFMSEIGETSARVYLGLRLDHARKLLRSTGMKITEIGLASGFGSSSHFSRCYRERFGLSPRQDRKVRISRNAALSVAYSQATD